MSVFRNNAVGDLTRGGQTTIHFMRMIWQVAKKFLHLCLILYIVLAALLGYYSTTESERYYGLKWCESYFAAEVLHAGTTTTKLKFSNNREGVVPYQAILKHPVIVSQVQRFYRQVIFALVGSFFAMLGMGFFIVRYIYKTGRLQAGDDFIRGTEVVPLRRLNKTLRAFNQKNSRGLSSGISIAGIELPYQFDKSHVILVGSTGTGKSVHFREALSSIRKLGKRAIVYDVSGHFIRHFYRQGKDIILNPLDDRSAYWDIWCDCKEESDFIGLAEALIPEGYKKDFFDTAAKMVFSSMAYQMGLRQNPTTQKLMDLILKVDFETIAASVKGTDAASLLNDEAGRMAASVRGVMSVHTRALKFLRQEGRRFSIADWVHGDADSWVFISCNDKQIDMMRPIITAWFNIFTSNVLSLSEDEARRIYMVVDELPSLNKIPSLMNFLAQGRKYGGSALIGIQNYAQLIGLYGKNGADAICDLCSTWLVLRCNSKEGARWAAENLGNRESMETHEGLSFGIHDMRDGVNVNKNRSERLVVSPTEIMNLPDLSGYLKLGRGFPIAKFESLYKNYPVVAEAFVNFNKDSGAAEGNRVDVELELEKEEGWALEEKQVARKGAISVNQEIEMFLNEMEF
jgi:type IV conjugative transfer system coupling protein TraD